MTNRMAFLLIVVAALALAAPTTASAASFPCSQFDTYVKQERKAIERTLVPRAAAAADRALSEVVDVVDQRSCKRFKYHMVHRWLARQYEKALLARDAAWAEGGSTAETVGRLYGLKGPIRFIERAGRKRGIWLPPIAKPGDE